MVSSPKKDIHNPLVRGDIIKKAFDQLDIFGPTFKELLVKNIEFNGIVLDSENYYSLDEIEKPLHVIFGEDVTPLILARLERGIRAQSHLHLH